MSRSQRNSREEKTSKMEEPDDTDIETQYLAALTRISAQIKQGKAPCFYGDQSAGDEAFQELLGDLNLSFLQTSVLHYTDEDRQLMEAVQLMVEKVRSQLSYGGDLVNIGSCQDGTKVQRLDELDLLYVLPSSRSLGISRTDISHVYDVRDGGGNPLNPRKERRKFADELESIFKEITLPAGLEHCGLLSPEEFSGVRYNGPAVTTLFTWQQERDISIDMTLVYQLPPEDRADLQQKINHRSKRLFEENSQRLLHVKGTYLYPNIVTDRWELSTAHCEADILAYLPTDAPFKVAVQISKIICGRLAANKLRMIRRKSVLHREATANSQSKIMAQVEVCEYHDMKRSLMRYGHVFLLPEEGPTNNELTKKLISINTAGVKHIALAVASKLSGAFKSSPDRKIILAHLLSEIFLYLGGSQTSVNHFFVDSTIGLFAIAPWAATNHNIKELIETIKTECTQIAWTLYPERFGLVNVQSYRCALQNYVLSFGEHCSEDICKVEVDFSGKGCNTTFDILMKLINGMANSYGGVILLDGNDASERVKGIWQAAFLHHFQMSTSGVLYLDDIIQVIMNDCHSPYIYVKRSIEFWTLNSNLCTYENGISSMSRDLVALSNSRIMSSDVPVFDLSQITKESFHVGEEIEVPTNTTIYCSELQHEWEMISCNMLLELPIVSMPNRTEGGLILLGVQETDGKLLATGVKLNTKAQDILTESLACVLKECPVTKESRFWGEGFYPKWSLKFVPVFEVPEHVVVFIQMYPHESGIFFASPEAYSFSIDGSISPVAYQDWVSKVAHFPVKEFYHQGSSSSTPSQNSANQLQTVVKPKEWRDTNVKSSQQKVQPFLHKATHLSWVDNVEDWRSNLVLTSRFLNSNAIKLTRSEIFEFQDPLNFTPPATVMCESSSVVSKDSFEAISKHHSPKSGFGICADNFASLIGCHEAEIEDSVDILTVDRDSNIEIWTTGKHSDTRIQVRHVNMLGATLKRMILDELDEIEISGSKRPNIFVGCHILDDTGNEINLPMLNVTSSHIENTIPVEHICAALAKIFLSQATLLKTRLGRELAVNLTAQQFQQELQSMFRTFNVVEGPPGSGKTVLALRAYLCHAKSTAVFLAINPAMKSFLEFQGVEEIVLLQNPGDVTKIIRSGILAGRRCIIMDDVQHLAFSAKVWNKFFQHINHAKTRLYAFMDNSCQSFNITKKSDSFMYHLEKFCDRANTSLNVRHLDEVHRNSRKMVSYIKECHSGMESIPCSSIEEGDDVTVIKMTNIRNNDKDNSLVAYIRSLTSSPEKWHLSGSYMLTDIAVLLDGSTCEGDIATFRTILREQGPFAVQKAGVFPVGGITVDALDNFVGLDAEVILFITSEEIISQHSIPRLRLSSKKRSLLNGRYKAFISSRAVSRLVFIVETNLNLHITKNLHFDSDKLSRTVEKSLEEQRSKAVVKLWHTDQHRAFTSACFLRRQHGWALLCVTFRPNVHLIDINTGEHLPLEDLGFEPRQIVLADVSMSQKYLLVVHTVSDQPKEPWRWRVYSNDETELKEVSSQPIRWIPRAITSTPEDDVLLLVYKDSYREPHLLKFTIDGQLLWDHSDDVTKFDVPEDMAVGRNGKIYVAEYYNHGIRVLTPKGHFNRNIPQTLDDFVLYAPKALCLDSTGRWLWVSLNQADRWQLTMVSIDGKRVMSVLDVDCRAYSVDVIEEKLLVVGTKKGLLLYDVSLIYNSLE